MTIFRLLKLKIMLHGGRENHVEGEDERRTFLPAFFFISFIQRHNNNCGTSQNKKKKWNYIGMQTNEPDENPRQDQSEFCRLQKIKYTWEFFCFINSFFIITVQFGNSNIVCQHDNNNIYSLLAYPRMQFYMLVQIPLLYMLMQI